MGGNFKYKKTLDTEELWSPTPPAQTFWFARQCCCQCFLRCAESRHEGISVQLVYPPF